MGICFTELEVHKLQTRWRAQIQQNHEMISLNFEYQIFAILYK